MTVILETLGYRAPLAVHCVDSATGADVADGLLAMAWPQGEPAAARTALRSRVSALLGFGMLPGLRAQELALAAGSTLPAWPTAAPKPFVITVTDTLGRYLPEAMTTDVPVAAPLEVTLYSAPARPQPPGWATVYGEVHASPGSQAAAWALVTVSDGTASQTAVTDEAGRFLVYLPYPEALPVLAGSPPAGGGIGMVSWPLSVTVNCEPTMLTWPANPAPVGPPDIASIRAQHQAHIVTAGGQQLSFQDTLAFGTPLLMLLTVVPA
jgi:hypothetical protein